ncbi:hypothetical protein RISK_002125 [Rhodopirellula islandica]|uniref:Uncharacterized protein n=1 Tax=Rhodopirellula islandica TaxID=595434 RepID=A0A0J1BG27_RHOIS|nr:hypothetical protein RISK_002125 [Rhodopirellula islandica]
MLKTETQHMNRRNLDQSMATLVSYVATFASIQEGTQTSCAR